MEHIEEAPAQEVDLLIESNDGSPNKASKGQKKLEAVYSDDFIIDSQIIEKKDIKNYIAGRVLPVLGEDYYYGFVYRDSVLSFIALKSNSYDGGKISVLTAAFLSPGTYFYRDGMKYYVISHNEDGFMKTVVSYEHPSEGVDLSDFNYTDIPQDIPQSLIFKWSLLKQQRPINFILLAVFTLSLLFYGMSALSYSGISQQAKDLNNQANAKAGVEAKKLPDITQVVKECVGRLGGKGTIRQVKMENEAIIFSIDFPFENDAREFMEINGGKYENNQVVLALVAANSGQPSSGK